MEINTSGLDLDAVRKEYQKLNDAFQTLRATAKDEETERAIESHHVDVLGDFVSKTFDIKEEDFLRGAYTELCPLMGHEFGELMITPLAILYFKMGDILGTENPHIVEVYARRSPKH